MATFAIGLFVQLHTLPLPATHVGLATGLHTGRDSFAGITQEIDFHGRNHSFWYSPSCTMQPRVSDHQDGEEGQQQI